VQKVPKRTNIDEITSQFSRSARAVVPLQFIDIVELYANWDAKGILGRPRPSSRAISVAKSTVQEPSNWPLNPI